MRIESLLARAAVGALAALVIGCASSPHARAAPTVLDSLTQPANLPGKPACFWKSEFQGDWTVLNDTTLIVRAPLPKNAYVVKLFESVTDLSFLQRLGFEDKERTGQICNNNSDYLVIPGSPRRVTIIAVHALTPDEQNQLLEAAGKRKSRAGAGAGAGA